jgi:phosphoglycolate phosphatase
MIETAIAKAGATPGQTVMIGDTLHDMRMAKAAGVGAIGVGWGYHDEVELLRGGADKLISSFDDLDAAIDELTSA